MTKHCPKCNQDKPLTAEYWLPRRESKDGYRGYCRLCWYAQQKPNKRRHYRRHAGRLRAERRQWRKVNPLKAQLRDLRYYLKHRVKRNEYNRRYYWQTHEQRLAYARWYSKNVRPLRIDLGPEMPTDQIDMTIWQRQQDRQQAQQMAVEILTLAMQALTEDERRLLLTFEANDYDLSASAQALRIPATMASKQMERIRDVTRRAATLVAA